jgi:hypothetical protein
VPEQYSSKRRPRVSAGRFPRTALSALVPLAMAHMQPAVAGCTPEATSGNDTIVCAGTTGAPLDAGAGNDSVTNQGTLTGSDSVSDSVRPQPPDFSELESAEADFTIGSDSIAIRGGDGEDTISNSGRANSTATTSLASLSLPVTLTGGKDVSATNTVEAVATGIAGDTGTDGITNAGRIDASAATVLSGENVELNAADTTHGDTTTTVSAEASGIDAGEGSGGTVTNAGQVNAVATANSATSNVEVNLVDAATADSQLIVQAQAGALVAGAGGGTLTNTGNLAVQAQAQSEDVSANMTYLDITLADPTPADAGTKVIALGAGMDGGASAASLTLTNSGGIDVRADANLQALAIALASEGTPAGLKPVVDELMGDAPIAQIGIRSDSHAAGMTGGSGADTATNSGTVLIQADASAQQASINVGMALIDWGIPTPGIVIGSAGTRASSDAVGVDGGQGNDSVSNSDNIVAASQANAGAVTVSANISGFTDNAPGAPSTPGGSLGISVSVADTRTLAQADSIGLRGGGGDDTVANDGAIKAGAEAEGRAVSGSMSVNVEFGEGENMLGANAVAARASSIAESTAIGIDGGSASYRRGDPIRQVVAISSDHDVITNSGTINANAASDVLAVTASVVVGGTVKGAGAIFNVAAADTSAIGYATAIGVDAGSGNDEILNAGSIVAAADSEALSVGAALNVAFANQGAAVGVALARSESIAEATAEGIQGGSGLDSLTNEHSIQAAADADAMAVAVSVSVAGTMDGVSVSGAAAEGSAAASAAASGMDGGADSDVLRNAGAIEIADVTATSRTAAISVAMAGANNGVAVSGSLAQATASSTATATGLAGGDGDDQLANAGTVTLRNVSAGTDALSIGVSMSGAFTAGVTLAAAVTDSSTESRVRAIGLAGGNGNDTLVNSGSITASDGIGSNADSGSVSVALSGSLQGAALGAAMADASADAATLITGLDGGEGNDSIDNGGTISLRGAAEAGATSVAVTISAALGVGGGVELVDAEARAASAVAGIDGGAGSNTIRNSAGIDVESWADAESLGIGVGVTAAVGGNATMVDASANARADAAGIAEAGFTAGTSSILNTGRLDVLADATVTGKAISANLAGYAMGETSIESIADAQGIRGGAGATHIENRGVIDVTSQARADGWSLALTAAGRVEGDASAMADARASGITAGDGDDVVGNLAAITLDATSDARAVAIAAGAFGSVQADARADAITAAIALDGGAGNDVMTSSGDLDVNATSTTRAESLTVSLGSSSGADVLNAPVSRALAMSGGDGNDELGLGGASVVVAATATASIEQASWNLAGVTATRAGAEAIAGATGLEGGTGDDSLLQAADSLQITSTASASADSSSWTFAGDSATEAVLAAGARATGLDGGAGTDLIRNTTALAVTSSATLVTEGGDNAIFGSSSTNTEVGATAIATGVTGGADNDRIENTGDLTLLAESDVDSTRVSYTFAGGASIGELMKSRAALVGLEGGDGDDVVINTAAIEAVARAVATTSGAAATELGGGTTANGRALAEATAAGITGGNGDDAIHNSGRLHIAAIISPVANNSSSSGVFFGNARVDAWAEGELEAVGIDGGDGNDTIGNSAEVTVLATTATDAHAFSYSSGSDFSFGMDGNGVGHAEFIVDGRATGIRAGVGDDFVWNGGHISVQMQDMTARGENDANAGDTSGYGLGNVNSTVRAYGNGIDLGDGIDTLENAGRIDVNVSAAAWGWSDVDGTFTGNAHSTINPTAVGEGRGVLAGNGTHAILNTGEIRVTASPVAQGFAHVDSGYENGNAVGTVNNIATGRAAGIETGNGDSRIENSGLLVVVAAPQATAPANYNYTNVFAYGDHPDLDTTNGDAEAFVRSVGTGEAYGIRTGVGQHSIVNSAVIDVSANAVAQGGYDVNPGNGPAGHAHTETRVFAFGSATGIGLGGGDASILNSGNILATATPFAGMGFGLGDGGPFQFRESYGSAVGVDGGAAGAQSVTNDGTIHAVASGMATGVDNGNALDLAQHRIGGTPSAVGVQLQGEGYKTVVNNGVIDARASFGSAGPFEPGIAYGIHASGDGVMVVNNGTITAQAAWVIFDLGTGDAVRMSSRNGEDLVLGLGRESVTNGNVVMQGGRSTLMLDGNPVLNGNLTVDTDRDFDLVLDNDGYFGHALPTVAHVTKNGAGFYSLPTINTVQGMTLNAGTLALASSYDFAPAGTLQVAVHSDGSHGALDAVGDVRLDGSLRVQRDTGLYADGTRYDIISAAAMQSGGAFDAIELPDATALVSFTTEQSADTFSVLTHVGSFHSLAQGGSQRAIAASLDVAALDPSDEMRLQLAAIQRLPEEELRRTYQSLNPVAYDFVSSAAAGNHSQFADALWQRLSDPAGSDSGAGMAGAGGRELSRMQVERQSRAARELGTWMRVFGSEGERSGGASAGYGYEQEGLAIGYDRIVGKVTVGVSLGFVNNRVNNADDPGSSRVDSTLYSIYGGYADERGYVDGLLTHGRNDYRLTRQIVIGEQTSDAASSHRGDGLALGISGGLRREWNGWTTGPFASLQYIRVSQPGFSEEGGLLSLRIEARKPQSLVSHLGGRIARRIAAGNAEWAPELSLAWLHEQALDDRDVKAAFAGAPEAGFSIHAPSARSDGAVAGLGVSYRLGGFSARLNWRGEWRSGSTAHALFAGIRYML